jgi:nucleoside-diphosphate-sugar epimerase
MTDNVLVIGASGQIGSELTLALRKNYGDASVFATDIRQPPKDVIENGQFHLLDVLDEKRLGHFVTRYKITRIYHLAAILSGSAEKVHLQAWDINMRSLINVLKISNEVGIKRIFWPSSIAVFGKTTPKEKTPQLTIMEPNTIYGISKLAGERWNEYYYNRFRVDIRSIRYPGLISYKAEAGGGTSDYAVEIFYDAVKYKKYECFLREDTTLPMMFMPDAIRASLELMETEASKLSFHSSYNLNAISFSPGELAAEIIKYMPDFKIDYKPDFRQVIADSWPRSIDDSVARKDWGWKHEYGLKEIVDIMLREIKKKTK